MEREEERMGALWAARDVQGESGNWDHSPYMMGLYNGLELAVAILEGRDPEYRFAPKQWGSAVVYHGETPQGEEDESGA